MDVQKILSSRFKFRSIKVTIYRRSLVDPGPNSRMEKYKAQLEQVNASLTKSPDNLNLLNLKSKLEKLLELQKIEKNDSLNTNGKKEHDFDFPLQVGEACEIFDENAKYWKLGNIISMTLDRNFYIVSVEKTKITLRVPSTQIRRLMHRETKASAKPSSKMIRKPVSTSFKPRKLQPELEGPNQWKKFTDKMGKK